MPELNRVIAIVESSILSTAEDLAEQWDVEGAGTGTFNEGAKLSDDGGASHTHSACNVLVSCIDLSIIEDFSSDYDLAGLADVLVYACEDRLGEGIVHYLDSGAWVQVGDGDFTDVILADAGLVRYETETI